MIDQGKGGSLYIYIYVYMFYLLFISTYIHTHIYIYTLIYVFRGLHENIDDGCFQWYRIPFLELSKPAGLHHSLSKSFRNFEVGEFCESSFFAKPCL